RGVCGRRRPPPPPAPILAGPVLPARLPEYAPHALDALPASGAVLWPGSEPLGHHDGRIRLYLADHAPLLAPLSPPNAQLLTPDAQRPTLNAPVHDLIREHLATRGASFFPQLLQACVGGFYRETLHPLWDPA